MSDNNKALLTVNYGDDNTTFDLQLPLSSDYEIDISFYEDLRQVEDFDYKKQVDGGCHLKYRQGILHIHADCTQSQGIAVEAKDAEHTYTVLALADIARKENIKVSNVELQVIEPTEEDESE